MTLRILTEPSGSVDVMVSVIDVPVGAEVALSVKATVGARSLIVLVAVLLLVVTTELSVAFTYTVKPSVLAPSVFA